MIAIPRWLVPARWLFVPLALALPLLSGLAACTGSSEDDDDTEETPAGDDDDATQEPTPPPITVADGIYGLYNAYIFNADDYLLEPRGQLAVTSEVIGGSIVWRVFASTDDYIAGEELCTHVKDVSASPDASIAPNSGCEGCGVYYRVTFTDGTTPADSQACDAEVLAALEEANGDGDDALDIWGFSPVTGGDWPSRWYDISTWEDREDWLVEHDATYAIWSREFHDSKAAYLPLWATYDPATLTPIPDRP